MWQKLEIQLSNAVMRVSTVVNVGKLENIGGSTVV